MKLYRIPIEKVLYFGDVTKRVYEGDVASAASAVALALSFLAISVIRNSLLGATLFTVTCVMIVRIAIELKRKKKIIDSI